MVMQMIWVIIAICIIFAGLHVILGPPTRIRTIFGGIIMLIGATIMVLSLSYTVSDTSINPIDAPITFSSAESFSDNPYCPDGWIVEYHYPNESFELDKVELYLSDQQEGDTGIDGFALYEELKGKLVLNAYILDCLLICPSSIPKEWENKHVFFWGTIYRNSYDDLLVRCLFHYDGEWIWSCRCLDECWCSNDPAIVL